MAVRVYWVVEEGTTILDVRAVTSPTPLLMVMEVAPETLQDSVDTWPATMALGFAEKELITGADGEGVEPMVWST